MDKKKGKGILDFSSRQCDVEVDNDDVMSTPKAEHCQSWHQFSWTLSFEEGQELLQNNNAS